MDRRRLIVGIVIGVLLVGAIGGGSIYFATNTKARAQMLQQLDIEAGQVPGGGLLASGFIEAEEVEVSAELGGRVVELLAEEGDEVSAGDKLVQIDTSLLDAQRDIAEAELEIMKAQHDLLAAGPRDEVIRQMQTQVAVAQAMLNAAKTSWQDALAMTGNPQEFEIQLVEAQTQLRVAQEQLAAAQVQFKAAERTFHYANEVEKGHAQLYQNLLDSLGSSQETYPYYVCPVCGYTAGKEAPEVCPVCGTKREKFNRID